MKRDMDLMRNILFELEEYEHGYAPEELKLEKYEGYTEGQIYYHVHLMGEAGLMEVTDLTPYGSPSPYDTPFV